MTCKCGQHFCWLCGEATGAAHTWDSISGHTCGKFKDTESDTARRNLQSYPYTISFYYYLFIYYEWSFFFYFFDIFQYICTIF